MSDVAAVASSGFNYTATYDSASTGSVEWGATFRVGEVYRGVSHGHFSEAPEPTQADLRWTVVADIEETMGDTH